MINRTEIKLSENVTVGELRQALEPFDEALPVLLDMTGAWPDHPRLVCQMAMVYQRGVKEHIRVEAHWDDDDPWQGVVITSSAKYKLVHKQEA